MNRGYWNWIFQSWSARNSSNPETSNLNMLSGFSWSGQAVRIWIPSTIQGQSQDNPMLPAVTMWIGPIVDLLQEGEWGRGIVKERDVREVLIAGQSTSQIFAFWQICYCILCGLHEVWHSWALPTSAKLHAAH